MNIVLDTISYMSKLEQMNYWLYKRIEPYLGRRILDAGCGNGNLISYLLNRELVVAVDNDEVTLNVFKARFSQYNNLKISNCDLADLKIRKVASYNIDTIVCINTLEHIKDDFIVLNNFSEILQNGNLVIIVPAFEFLYCSLDRAAGHYRRYELNKLCVKLQKCGFTIVKSTYANFFGIIGWFFNGKLLRKERLSKGLLSIFNFFTPLFELFEKLTGPPIGLSIILICRKRQ